MNEKNYDFATNFAKNLTYLRKSKKISMQQLAEEIGLSRATLSHYENGNRLPEFENIIKLALYFQCSIDELIFSGTPIDINKLSKLNADNDDIDKLINNDDLVNALISTKEQLVQQTKDITEKLKEVNMILNLINTRFKK
ncbi:helix-turn-helix domain-containing protein [Paraclostridium bifermentans]|uniref:helix-turn-helix domain-containing protein n=1 Tax=Paraclostridium bifermentans TaxID=1490 RepID=UPI0025B0081F|nr:helix-turn-helix transcriptional regulator [Paraclostridium bifermentans]